MKTTRVARNHQHLSTDRQSPPGRPRSPQRLLHPYYSWRGGAMLLLVAMLLLPSRSSAQAPLERMYGVGDQEFIIGAYPATRHASDRISELWNLWDALGLTFLIDPYEGNPARIDSLVWSAGSTHRMVITDDELNNAGWGRNVQFFLFDSVETPYMVCKFTARSGGTYRLNPELNGFVNYPQERVYSTSHNTVANQVIADRIVFNHRPSQLYRFTPSWMIPESREDSIQNAWLFLNDHRFRWNDSLTYLVATGHLFADGESQQTDSLFKVEVFYEVDRGNTYYNSSDSLVTATDSLSFLAATRFITKADFTPPGANPNYDLYQEAVFPLDLKVLANGQRGPRYERTTSQRLNIRVTWLGGEQVALRSIALRDSLGQLMFGRGASHDAYKASLMDRVRRFIFGPSLNPDSLRRKIIGIYSGEEHMESEYAGYFKLDKMLRDTFNFLNPNNPNLRDSLPLFSAQSHTGGPDKDHDISRPQAVLQETYLNLLPNPKDGIHTYYPNSFNIPYAHLPSIAEQNGGRFHVPLLPLTEQGVADYELTLQYGFLGFNQPDSTYAKEYVRHHIAYKLGKHARTSKRTGRRLIIVPSPNADIHFPIDRTVTPARLDTMIGHIPTAAETRLLISMALAYGAKGIIYWWYGGYQNFINKYDSTAQLWCSEEPMGGGFGPSGSLTTDSSEDVVSSFTFTSSNHTPRITVPNLYVGRGTRSRALKKEVQWLQDIGPEIARLNWKNTYSIHYATPRANTKDTQYGFGTRPLPANEIITEVKSYKLNDTTADAPEATYVELGFFDKKTGTTNGQADSKKDTNYVFVVNRRTFEPPDYGTPLSQSRRDSMVALAGNRRIRLKLNLWRSGATQYEFVQVREVAADTTRLVGDSIIRQPVNVVVPANNGFVDVFMRPGAGSLLEITYRQPDETMIAGKLDYNNQRKLIY
ncbi:MAG: hypothetical protein IPM61_06395 [Chlorobi bacterium]|nr:MAG: hypothetical protein UZ07_CHB004000062 [Chlorobi bacterium OLB7]MBK8910941.1 hypothetical protein [Chlorobiota bacterium]